jgi:hypothetical protein
MKGTFVRAFARIKQNSLSARQKKDGKKKTFGPMRRIVCTAGTGDSVALRRNRSTSEKGGPTNSYNGFRICMVCNAHLGSGKNERSAAQMSAAFEKAAWPGQQ